MSIELKQAAQQASEAIDWMLNVIRRDAPQISGKAMGNAEKCATDLRTAIQQATQAEVTDEQIAACVKRASTYGLPFVGLLNPGGTPSDFSKRFTAEILALRPVQVPVGEPVYQIRGEGFECPHAWRDATEEAFFTTPAADRRTLYTNPAPSVSDGWAVVKRNAVESALQHVPYRGETWSALNAALQQPATAIACGIPGMVKTTCPYCEQGFSFEYTE